MQIKQWGGMREKFGKIMRNTNTMCHKIKMNLKILMHWGKRNKARQIMEKKKKTNNQKIS